MGQIRIYFLSCRNEDEYDSAAWFSDEEEVEEEEEEDGELKMSCNTSYHIISRDPKPDHLIADIRDNGESLVFYGNNSKSGPNNRDTKEFMNVHQTHEHEEEEDDQDSNISSTEEHFSSANVSPYRSESSIEDEDNGVEDLHDDRYDHDDDDEEIGGVSRYDVVEDLIRKRPNRSIRGPSPLQSGLVFNDKSYNGIIFFSPLFTCYFFVSSQANRKLFSFFLQVTKINTVSLIFLDKK